MLALFLFVAMLFPLELLYGQTPVEPALVEAQSLVEQGKLNEAETAVREYLKAHNNSAGGHYLLGYVLFKENNPKSSLAEYAEGARYREPGAIDLEVIGCDYFLMEDYGTADKWLTKSVQRDASNALALYFLGRAKYNEKRFEEAIRFFKECLELDPKNVKAEENLGLSYEALGNTQGALDAYRAAVAADAALKNPEPYMNLGTLLAKNERAGEAVPYLRDAVAIAPQNFQARRELGEAYLSVNEIEKAQAELEKAVALEPQDAPVHLLLAQVYRRRGFADRARIESEHYNALTSEHSSPDKPLDEARSLVERGKLSDAERVIRRYLDIHKNSADGHYVLGYILFKQQNAKASLAEYTEGAKYRQPSAHDLEVVASDYVLLKDYSDADKWFTESVEWNPGDVQTLYYLGRTKYNENRFEEAISVFTQCLKLDPKNVKAEDNLGLSYAGLGRTEDALAAYRTAISWEKDEAKDSGPYVDLGSLLVDSDRSIEAVPALLEAVRISPEELRAHRELGKAYLHLNQLEKAQTELEKCVELAPQDAPIHYMLAQAYRRRGLLDKASVENARYTTLTGAHSSPESSQ